MSLWKKLGFDELWETCKEIVKDVQEFDRKIDEKTKKWRVERKKDIFPIRNADGIPGFPVGVLDERKDD